MRSNSSSDSQRGPALSGRGTPRSHSRIVKLVLVTSLAVGCSLNLARFRKDVLDAPPDRAGNPDRRFEALRRELSGRQHVGYISDHESHGDPAERYFLAQLALAPVVVELDTSPDLVVGNFSWEGPPSVPPDLVLVHDYGDGVMLFTRR